MTCRLAWVRNYGRNMSLEKIYSYVFYISLYEMCSPAQTEVQYCLFAIFTFTLEDLKGNCDFFYLRHSVVSIQAIK